MPYNVGEIVQYGANGVCKISEITEKLFRDKEITFYVLTPVFGNQSTIFVPVDNDALVSKMRYTLNADEIVGIIKDVPTDCFEWIENENQRKLHFKDILQSGDSTKLVRLIKTLYHHQENQKSIGKKMHMVDERFFKDAKKLLCDEFAVALGLTPDEAHLRINDLFEN